MTHVVIFSDLDGTLLDETSYAFSEARSALDAVRRKGIPLVLVSSKTSAEIRSVRKRLENEHPFISENGGGVFIPDGYFPFAPDGELRGRYRVISLGSPYSVIRSVFRDLREELHAPVRGFGDMSVGDIAALTGLSPDEAVLASQREFDEPFIFDGAPDADFLGAIEQRGLRWTRGKIHHLMGNSDKGRAVRLLQGYFERTRSRMVTIGLGDGLNDLPMLQAVDHPVLVRRADGIHDPDVRLPALLRTEGIGPAGWGEAVQALLAKLV